MPIPPIPSGDATFPYPLHMDAKIILIGEYNAADPERTTWTLPFADATIDTIVLSSQFGRMEGIVLTPDSITNRKVRLAGDWSGGKVALGRSFSRSVKLSRPYRRDSAGVSLIGDRISIQKIITEHLNAHGYSIRAELPNRASRTKVFAPSVVDAQGEVVAWLSGDAEQLDIYLEDSSVKPSTITALEFYGRFAEGRT